MTEKNVVEVTLEDIYRELRMLADAVAKNSSVQRAANDLRMAEVRQLSLRADDHERRLRKVEAWSAALSLTAIGLLLAALGVI
jgi:hypothetical protein